MNDFMLTGTDGLALQKDARSVEKLSVVDLDALVGYLRTQASPFQPPAGTRLAIVGR